MKVTAFTDGSSRGNPGPAGIGVVILEEQVGGRLTKRFEIALPIGEATNNIAEYQAVLHAINRYKDIEPYVDLTIKTDSELAVKQLKGEYTVKSPNLRPLWAKARQLLNKFEAWDIEWIPRDQNKEADRLASEGVALGHS